MKIALTENLNCIIGVRGSGKSTLVEALRYVLGYNRTLGELDRLQNTIREMQRANLPGSLMRLVYQTSAGDVRILEATFDEKSDYVTKVYTPDGDFVDVADVEASGDYPVRLFGWNEIETLGRSPARQRDLLDRLVPELGPVLGKRDEIGGRLRANKASVQKVIAEVKEAYGASDREIRRFTECKADFGKLNTPAVKGLFSALDLAQHKRRILARVKDSVAGVIKRLGDPEELTVRKDLDSLLEQGEQELRDWWLNVEMSRLGILAAEQEVQGAIRQARERLKALTTLSDQHIEEIDTEIEQLQQRKRPPQPLLTSRLFWRAC